MFLGTVEYHAFKLLRNSCFICGKIDNIFRIVAVEVIFWISIKEERWIKSGVNGSNERTKELLPCQLLSAIFISWEIKTVKDIFLEFSFKKINQ